jgi:hypothetical protein
MTDVLAPENSQVRYGVENTYGDGDYSSGCGGHNPAFHWIGIIEDVTSNYDNSLRECRGIGSIDISALATGMRNPEVSIKWIVQRKRGSTFVPLTFMNYAVTPPVGITIGQEATFGSSYLSLWYKGMMMDSLDVDFSIDDFIRATAKLVGRDVTVDNDLITADSRDTYAPDPVNSYYLPLTGQDAEVFLNSAGATDGDEAGVKKVHFYIKNNYVRIPVVRTTDSDLLAYILRGKRELGGELTIYVESFYELNRLKESTLMDLRINLQKTDDSPYFDFTNVKLDTGQLSTKVNEVPCELQIPFKAGAISTG